MNAGRTKEAITAETLAPLSAEHAEHWRIWPSAQGGLACATLRRALSWTRPYGSSPSDGRGPYVLTLIEDSPRQLAEAITRENTTIARLLERGALAEAGRR